MDRRTLRKTDPIVGDAPIDCIRIGFQWDIWPTKHGNLVARTSWEDGNGYQIEAKNRSDLERDIRIHLRQVERINREILG